MNDAQAGNQSDSWKQRFCWENVIKRSSVNAAGASYEQWNPFRNTIFQEVTRFVFFSFHDFFTNSKNACCTRCTLYTVWKVSVFGVYLVRIQSRMRENADQKNSEYRHYTQWYCFWIFLKSLFSYLFIIWIFYMLWL